ncbi:MAG: DUF4389 domain-containing protein [Dehalococcoidia bacterium]
MRQEVPPAPQDYPVRFDVEARTEGRNRLTVLFRYILGIPHLLLVGGPEPFTVVLSILSAAEVIDVPAFVTVPTGILGLAALAVAFISWFAILFTGRQPRGLWDFQNFYLRWLANATGYLALLRDEYPPFGAGDEAYPVRFDAGRFPEQRSRLSVGFRLILAIPHGIILAILSIAWWMTVIFAWFAILITGRYPRGLYEFGVGYWRWSLRVQAYMLLMRDEYPPFGFGARA